MSTRPPSGGGSASPAQSAILVALILLAGVVIYKVLLKGETLGSLLDFGSGKEVKLTYVPSDFKPSINEESALEILAHPEKYKKEFDDLVYNLNLSMLYHVANRMNLADSLRYKLEPEYKRHHIYLKDLYYQDFIALKDTSATDAETWYSANGGNAVALFNEVAGKYTCFFVTAVLATVIKADQGRLMAKGKNVDTPCGLAVNEGLKPLLERMSKKAAIADFTASRGFMKEKVSRGIAELATFEIQSRKAVSDQVKYKILGYSVSTTEVEISAYSTIKAGFDLQKYFDVTLNPDKNTVFVTLPDPEILSHEVFPKVDKLDVGWLSGMQGETFNENINALRREFRSEAIEQDKILESARLKADSIIQLMMQPVAKGINKRYKVQVRFKNGGGAPAPIGEEERRRQGVDGVKPAAVVTQPIKKPGGFIPN
jgi:Protein of unknown function (DUF4230)